MIQLAIRNKSGEILLFRFAGHPWAKAKLRKPSPCALCKVRLEIGIRAFRPLDNGKDRQSRICATCANDLTKHD